MVIFGMTTLHDTHYSIMLETILYTIMLCTLFLRELLQQQILLIMLYFFQHMIIMIHDLKQIRGLLLLQKRVCTTYMDMLGLMHEHETEE